MNKENRANQGKEKIYMKIYTIYSRRPGDNGRTKYWASEAVW